MGHGHNRKKSDDRDPNGTEPILIEDLPVLLERPSEQTQTNLPEWDWLETYNFFFLHWCHGYS